MTFRRMMVARRTVRIGGQQIALSYRSILGALLVEMWDARSGIATAGGNVISWTGLILGTVVSAPSVPTRPPYAADGAFFGGKSVVQPVAATQKCLVASGLPTLLASGTRPWVFNRQRYQSASANGVISDFGALAVSDDVNNRLNAGATNYEGYFAGIAVAGPIFDTGVHSTQMFMDGVNANWLLDGTSYTTASAGTLSHNVTGIGFGRAASGTYHYSSSSIAQVIVCSAKPSAAQVAGVQALSVADYPA